MVNINKLKGKIVERGINIRTLAKIIGIDGATLYRKFNKGGNTITIKEANLIVQALNLNIEEINEIFFTDNVA